ncbi:MAG: hypothetical protein HY897_10490 [Deltaproteobacteria bacterium]|nr:hypothetical protein [Deltaproteobacteria bacterium]
MKQDPFRLLVCDFDSRRAFVTGEVFDAAPYLAKVDELRDEGRNITCQALPPVETAVHREIAARFCRKHNLTLLEKPFLKVG